MPNRLVVARAECPTNKERLVTGGSQVQVANRKLQYRPWTLKSHNKPGNCRLTDDSMASIEDRLS